MPRDEATVDRIFAGDLGDLPPLSSKVTTTSFLISTKHQNSEPWPGIERRGVMFYFMTALNFKLNLHLQNGILNFDSCVSQSFFRW